MAIIYSKQQAMDDLPFIGDKDLFRAVDLALWLYLEQRRSLKYSVDKASEKRGYKPKVAIERLMRQVIPEEVIWDRMEDSRPVVNTGKVSKEFAIRNQRMKKVEQDGKQHVNDFTSES
ncbi:hypothetical protein DS891_18620 [Pseudoalteromonas sp. JC28]|uniref:hypothetical protein n=1 Tax=Pseudoalteromonas sp. JC28 TaxID=2267617 RepID=UPI0015738E9D|nr:hypothetical protein [Pseudoalteromonas sp. JC28]NSY35549.1 hypothetical protein [Pseudoalteromonas sp. JC28]QWV04838.1 hypothetical protein KQ246_16145 [Pseudoalteromonas shioyasakiensis]